MKQMKKADVLGRRDCSGFLISSMSRSSGKTVISIGLAAAAYGAGHAVQCYKKGPDYIDPLWLGRASRRTCFNLDPVIQSSEELEHTFSQNRGDASLVLVEGSQGLHDGLMDDWSDSNAGLSRRLKLPVLLVIDAIGMNRTIASLISGLVDFDPDVEFAGVILNRIKSERHEQKLRQAIEGHTRLSVLGAVPDCKSLHIEERELGLVPAPAHGAVDLKIEKIARQIRQHCDVNTVVEKSLWEDVISEPRLTRKPTHSGNTRIDTPLRTVAVARDEAFQFYYEDDLAALAKRGVRLVDVSPLRDDFPDHIDGMLIGGGFPERYAKELGANRHFRIGLKNAVNAGLAVRAECAGLMYLCRTLSLDHASYPMCNVIDAAVHIRKKPVGRGYMRVECDSALANLANVDDVSRFNAHEFHHSEIQFDKPPSFAFKVLRGQGTDGENDGVLVQNVIASYAHFRHTATTPWIDWFMAQLDGRNLPQYGQALESIEHV